MACTCCNAFDIAWKLYGKQDARNTQKRKETRHKDRGLRPAKTGQNARKKNARKRINCKDFGTMSTRKKGKEKKARKRIRKETMDRVNATRKNRARKEATLKELKIYAKLFVEAKSAELKSWFDNDVFDLVDIRKLKPKNLVTGRLVLAAKRD